MEYSSNSKGNLGVTLGAVGTGLGILGGNGGLLGGLFGNDNYVTKESLNLQMQLIDAQKDNAVLASDLNAERKVSALREEFYTGMKSISDKINDNAAAQAVINCQFNSQMNLNTSQIAQLFTLTKMVIPSTNVCTASTTTTT